MLPDRSFVEMNRAATERIRALVAELGDAELGRRVGQHWTVAIALAHLAFWDQRVLYVLDSTERAGKLSTPQIDVAVNDIALPLWAAVPPRAAARICVETAEKLDGRLETFLEALLGEIYAYNKRWVVRAWHRREHLDEVEAALGR
jgi:hypothetical protein